ncbi:MAG: 16S rRNA (adenine(1518)-N(6)/adenine(1519)-N(6))-dimethyltransferase RsmA [Candidatus Omnitrophota bacterium]
MDAHIGQNFLANRNVAEKIVKRFFPVEGEILEIGPGKGILTELLIKNRQGNKITAVELDNVLYYKLKEKYTENIDFLNRDILKIDLLRLFPDAPSGVNLIGNVPYYISKELIDWVIRYFPKVKKGIFMMQKEFVDKLGAAVGTRDYNAQAVTFNRLFRLEKLFDVQPGSFTPQPRVKSTVFLFEPANANGREPIAIPDFYRFVQHCFSQRRKTVLNNFAELSGIESLWDAFEALHINPKARAEELTLEEFEAVYRYYRCSHEKVLGENNK